MRGKMEALKRLFLTFFSDARRSMNEVAERRLRQRCGTAACAVNEAMTEKGAADMQSAQPP